MSSHTALVLTRASHLEFQDVPTHAPAAGQVNLRIHAAALNHRDVWIQQGKYAGIVFPSILGSDGAGVVEAVGEGVDTTWLGREVLINPSNRWGDNPAAQGPDYHILGLPSAGTLQQVLTVPADRLHPKPAHLTFAQAAALPLAGLTAYRALVTQGQIRAGHRVLVTGIGGGVALFALQFAVALGAEVYATSSSPDKLARAIQLGAKSGLNYREANWGATLKKQTGGMHLVIDSAGGDALNDALDSLLPGGSLVLYGATAGLSSGLNLRRIFWNQLRIQGSTMGSDADFAAMLELVSAHQLLPVVDSVRPFAEAIDAFAAMAAGQQFGKLVLSLG